MAFAAALPAITAGLGALSGFMGGQDNKQMSAAQLAEQKRQFDIQSRQRAAESALNATQMDPLRQQKSRQQQALVEQLMKGAKSPTLNVGAGKFEGGFNYSPEMFKQIASFFTPEARAAAEGGFNTNASTATGGQYAAPNLGAVGYGPAPTTGLPGAPPVPGAQNQLPGVPEPLEADREPGIAGALDFLKRKNAYSRQAANPFDGQGF